MLALWGEAVRSVEERVKPTQRDQWLRPITFLGFEGGRIHLRAPNRYQKEWFEDHYLPAILSDLELRLKRTFSVDFEVVDEKVTQEGIQEPIEDARVEQVAVRARPARRVSIAGTPSTRSWSVRPTSSPMLLRAWWPTHPPRSTTPFSSMAASDLARRTLLHAVGHEIHRQHPDWNITVVTCEQFVVELHRLDAQPAPPIRKRSRQ